MQAQWHNIISCLWEPIGYFLYLLVPKLNLGIGDRLMLLKLRLPRIVEDVDCVDQQQLSGLNTVVSQSHTFTVFLRRMN